MNKNLTMDAFGLESDDNSPLKVLSEFIFVENNLKKSDIILIPGSDEIQLIHKAIELYKNGMAPIITISGGPNNNIKSHSTEADFLAAIAIENNIPRDALILEDKARNTFENARYTSLLLKSNNIKIESAILVTKAYHSRRALLTYQRYFSQNVKLSVCSIPGSDDIMRDNWYKDLLKTHIVMNEIVKIGAYFEHEIPAFTG